MVLSKCNVFVVVKVMLVDVEGIKTEAAKKKDEDARKAAAEKIMEIVNVVLFVEELYLIDLFEVVIMFVGDNKFSNVCVVGDAAVAVIAFKLSEFAVRSAL